MVGVFSEAQKRLIEKERSRSRINGKLSPKAGDIASLVNEFEMLAVRSGAAVMFGAHYPKGNQAGKDAIDRIAGSGVFARDPDTILTFTYQEEDQPNNRCFSVELTLRNHPPKEEFAVRWQYPVFIVDDNLDPTRLKQTGGRPHAATQEKLLALLDDKALKPADWEKAAFDKLKLSRRTYFRMKAELVKQKKVLLIAGMFTRNE